MARKAYQQLSTRSTPQSRPIPGRDMVRNDAGGYVFDAGDWAMLSRFLILGVEGGTFYASERSHAIRNCETALRCLAQNGLRVVEMATGVSTGGKAYRNSPALFVLALATAHEDLEVRRAAFDALPRVARTGTHLFEFMDYMKQHRGSSRLARRGVGAWYIEMAPEKLAYQLIKYRQRYGWTHKDVLRFAHPDPPSPEHDTLYGWATKGELPLNAEGLGIRLIEDFVLLQQVETVQAACAILEANRSLPWEAIPTQFLSGPEVWRVMLPRMPITATIRNLGRMTSNGALVQFSPEVDIVAEKLVNPDLIKWGRVHPMQFLAALHVYAAGVSAFTMRENYRAHSRRHPYEQEREPLRWTPVSRITDALNDGFYGAFDYLEPTGKRHLIAIDASGSMTNYQIMDIPGLQPRMAAVALGLAVARTEPQYEVIAYDHEVYGVTWSKRMRLDGAMKAFPRTGRFTDCSLPMVWALEQKVPVDIFVIITDNETWSGRIHPTQALRQYRDKMGINAKMVVLATTATQFTIADPKDPGQLDIAGFSADVPAVVAGFATA